MPFHGLFAEIAVLMTLAAVVAAVGLVIRLPLIVGFLLAGALAGVAGFQQGEMVEALDLFAEIGVALLLFLVGLKLDPGLLRTLGGVAVLAGLAQVALSTLLGFLLCLALGFEGVTAGYLAIGLAFSSTIVVVKLMSDLRAVDSLHGRLAIGLLIVQDLVVIVVMVGLALTGLAGEESGDPLAGGLYALALLAALVAFARWGAEPLLRRLARQPELLQIAGVAWALLLAAVFDLLGFGKELGGLLAGVALASTPYREALAARLTGLRDFLLLFFFVLLGTELHPDEVLGQLAPAAILAAFVLLSKPLIVSVLLSRLHYRPRTAFLAGLGVSQISEFTLILVTLGVGLGHLTPDLLGLATLVALFTIAGSSLAMTRAQTIYGLIERPLGWLEPRTGLSREEIGEAMPLGGGAEVVLFGLGRFGRECAKRLHERQHSVLGVDFDPDALRRWRARGLPGLYGDAGDPEFLAHLHLEHTRWVVAGFPPPAAGPADLDPRRVVIETCREVGFTGKIAVLSHEPADVLAMYRAGADLVLLPYADAAAEAVDQMLAPEESPDESAGAAADQPPAVVTTR